MGSSDSRVESEAQRGGSTGSRRGWREAGRQLMGVGGVGTVDEEEGRRGSDLDRGRSNGQGES